MPDEKEHKDYNVPQAPDTPRKIYRPQKLTIQDIRDGCVFLSNGDHTGARICVINEEFRAGFDFIGQFEKSITMFGSARLPEDHPAYQKARSIGRKIAEQLHYAVITGGGPGIMEAGNRGAFEGGGESIGMTIALPMEQFTNEYVTHEQPFYFFFSRKVTMTYSAEAYLYFPGGFGTLDELFEILTLVQTKKIAPVPIVLVGREFWEPLDAFIKSTLLNEFKTISSEDLNLYTITDDEDEILEIVRNAPLRNED